MRCGCCRCCGCCCRRCRKLARNRRDAAAAPVVHAERADHCARDRSRSAWGTPPRPPPSIPRLGLADRRLWVVGRGGVSRCGIRLAHARFCRRMLGECGASGGSRGGVHVIETDAARGPLAFGIWRRYVAFPRDFTDRYDADERDLALAHELGHHARGDLIANWVALVVLALHWFNPVAWRAFRAFRADQEMANDARVLAGRDADLRHAYACAIVKAAHGGAVSAACHLHTIDDLKGRLRMLSTTRKSRGRVAWRRRDRRHADRHRPRPHRLGHPGRRAASGQGRARRPASISPRSVATRGRGSGVAGGAPSALRGGCRRRRRSRSAPLPPRPVDRRRRPRRKRDPRRAAGAASDRRPSRSVDGKHDPQAQVDDRRSARHARGQLRARCGDGDRKQMVINDQSGGRQARIIICTDRIRRSRPRARQRAPRSPPMRPISNATPIVRRLPGCRPRAAA